VIKKWKQRQQLAKWLKDHGKNLEEINSLLEQWGKGEQSLQSSPSSGGRPYFARLAIHWLMLSSDGDWSLG